MAWRCIVASYAIIPAAGLSRRMGQPKLLLPWSDSTVIQCVIRAWQSSQVSKIVAVVRPDDDELQQLCRATGIEVVAPDIPPPEMKDSVRLGLDYVAQSFAPQADDAWLLAPADMPQLNAAVIDRLLSAHDPRDLPRTILAPAKDGRRGHPVLFPWPLAEEVVNLAAEEGINVLLDRHPVRLIEFTDPSILDDVDTPGDYERLRERS